MMKSLINDVRHQAVTALSIKGENEDTGFECVCANLMNEASRDWSDSPQCLSFLPSSPIPLLLTCLTTSVMQQRQFCVTELNAVSGFCTVNVCPLVQNLLLLNESNIKQFLVNNFTTSSLSLFSFADLAYILHKIVYIQKLCESKL